MALFSKDSNKEPRTSNEDLSWVIMNPRVTEKAAMLTDGNTYTFDVATRANKVQIKKAVAQTYKVTPIAVNVIKQAPRSETRRGRAVHRKAIKKAMVTLKKGDSIEFA